MGAETIMPKPRKPLSDARRRLSVADKSLARAHKNVESMERMVAQMKYDGDDTGGAEGLLVQFKGAVAVRTKAHASAEAEYLQLKASQEEPHGET